MSLDTKDHSQSTGAPDSSAKSNSPPRRPVNLRTIALGLVGVVFICALTPFNDFVADNTNLVGNHLPVGLLFFFLLLILVVNTPLWKWSPKNALRGSELAVVLGMMLVSCALPSVGLMRYLPGHLTAFFTEATSNPDYASVLRQVDAPSWMFPTFKHTDPVARGNEAVVREYNQRAPVGDNRFTSHWNAVPLVTLRTPALTWGLFVAMLFGAMICVSVIFRHQWAENERLPFPLAGIELSLIESPTGRSPLNDLLSNRTFWIAAAIPFVLHGISALHVYNPRYFPEISLGYNLYGLMNQPPFIYADRTLKIADIFFTIIGISFFLQTRVSFSIFFFYLFGQAVHMYMNSFGASLTGSMRLDQMAGATIPFALTAIWIARRHLWCVIQQMFRALREGEARGRYLPYALAGWGFVACFVGLHIWLLAAGASFAGATVIVCFMFLIYLCLARTVAATGMLYVLLPITPAQIWIYALHYFGVRTTLRSFFYSNWFFGMFLHDTREALPVYAMHAMHVADEAAYPHERNWRRAIPFTLCLVLALAVGYVVSGASMLYCEYTYSATLSNPPSEPINPWGAHEMPREIVLRDSLDYLRPNPGHSRPRHLIFGITLSAALSFLSLRYTWWPLSPVGYLLAYGWGIGEVWFSVMLGWLAKVILVRFGGSSAFVHAKKFMIGLIIGEASTAMFWLLINLIRLAMGLQYYRIRILPI